MIFELNTKIDGNYKVRHAQIKIDYFMSASTKPLSGRRTFAVRLKRHGVDVPTIHLMLGNKSLETTLRLIETDTVSMLAIADMAF